MHKRDEETWRLFMGSAQKILQIVDERLKQQQLPPLAWYDVLLELHKAPHGRLRFKTIGERILLSNSNVTRLIARLEAKGYVRRERSREDGRGVYASITPAGEQLLAAMWPTYKSAVEELFAAKLTQHDRKAFYQVLQKLARDLF
jgi:DNA-binding MarR family transcriptional regulator